MGCDVDSLSLELVQKLGHVKNFLDMTDSGLNYAALAKDPRIRGYAYRLVNRLLPREVYRLGGDVSSHAQGALLTVFLNDLQKKEIRDIRVAELEEAIGKELIRIDPSMGPTAQDALCTAGVWVDVPRPPKFEELDELLIGGAQDDPGIPLLELFPIGKWTQAYAHFRYYVRVFAFSEYWKITEVAAREAMQRVIGIQAPSFYQQAKRARS